MKKQPLFTALFLAACLTAKAQEPSAPAVPKPFNPPVSVEVFAGNKYTTFQNFISKRFSENSRLGFYHIVTYNVDNTSSLHNTLAVQSLLNFKVFDGFTPGIGGYINKNQFYPIAAAQYTYVKKSFFTTVLPTASVSSSADVQSLLAIFQYRPQLGEQVKGYARLQCYDAFTGFDQSTFAYEQVRLGVEVKKVQFGLGVTFDQYQGKVDFQDANLGFFVRKELFN